MPENSQLKQTSPGIDLLAAGFFLAWAAVGWVAYLGNEPLRRSLFASPDPGPALLALIALWILTAGGAVIGIKGAYRALTERPGNAEETLPRLRQHLAPLLFILGVLASIVLMRRIGFPLAGFSLSAICLYFLSAGMRFSPRSALLAVFFGAIMTAIVYYIFVKLLLVPLPR